MKLKSSFKRILSGTLSVAMAATLLPSLPAVAENFTMQNYVYDNYSVSYNVTNSWGNTEIVSVTLSNTGDSTIENWMLYFDPNGSTSNIWDAQWAETSTGVSYVKNAGYNASIEPDSSITFSYTVDNCEAVPEAFTLCQKRVSKESGYDVQLMVNETWGDNFNGAIVINNNTDLPIEAWELTFDTNFTITEITNSWAADVTELEPYSYRLKGTYTGTISANSSVTLGFTGVKNGDPEISNASLTEVTANEGLIDFIKNYPDGVSIYAYGDYNNEANAIDIEWYTDYEAEAFDIWQSDDNESYTLVSEVSDADSYQYAITEDFETKYFKVSIPNDFDETIESIPFVVTKTEDGYSVDFLDSDYDGLPDIYENMISTDLNNPDTDGDGLTDYQEVYITGTDPTKYDSVTEGVSDADADSDGDGLSNAYEIELGTDPKYADTDDDGLTDGDEINIYNTDPLNPDTDEDGVNDGDEIVLGLDPLKPDTDDNGVLDGDEYFEQTVEQSRFDSDLFEDNLAVPSVLTVSAKGNVNSNIDISEYTGHLKGEERVYVGKVIEITNSEINGGSLSFTLSEDYTVKNYEVAGELTNGLLICYNDGEDTTPLATTYDEETRTLSADISAEGIYFVLDVISWLESLGLDIPSEASVETHPSVQTFAARAVSDAAASIATVQIKGQVDIVFVIDTTGSMSGYINNVKNNITAFVNEIESAGITPSFALVDYRDITCDGENSTNTKQNSDGSNWFKNADDFKAEIAKLTVGGGGDAPETAIDALEMARQLNLRASSQKFFVLVTDAGYKVDNNYGIESMSDMINLLVNDDINVSVVSNSSYQSTYKSLYESTGGVFANVGGNFKDELLSIADMINEETNSGCWIALNGLVPQIVKLDERPVWNGTADTDKDSLLDREELKSVWPTKYIDVAFYLYLLGLPLDYIYQTVPVYEYYSNPTKEDTDGDNLLDNFDPKPKSKNNNGAVMKELSIERIYNAYMLHLEDNVSEVYDIYTATGKDSEMSWEEFIEFYSGVADFNFSLKDASETELKITALQRCLEYLGFLDMGGSAYGAMGGATQSAVQNFQINYGLTIAQQVEFNDKSFIEIDEITYLTIANVAANHGFSINGVSSKEDVYKWIKSIAADGYNKDYYEKIPSTEPILDTNQTNEGITVYSENGKFDSLYYFNYSTPLNEVIDDLSNESRQYDVWYYGQATRYIEFISRVNHGEDWDVKIRSSWEKTIPAITYYSQKFAFRFESEIITSEDLGNLIYGCTGRFFGFSMNELNIGSFVAGSTGNSPDDARDEYYIQLGYDYYDTVKNRNGW